VEILHATSRLETSCSRVGRTSQSHSLEGPVRLTWSSKILPQTVRARWEGQALAQPNGAGKTTTLMALVLHNPTRAMLGSTAYRLAQTEPALSNPLDFAARQDCVKWHWHFRLRMPMRQVGRSSLAGHSQRGTSWPPESARCCSSSGR